MPGSRKIRFVLEPLSEPIRKLLFELRLCSPRDLRRCKRIVRGLTHDLPAFDSVWLDALVQIGRLAPYQAKILESSCPAKIRIGPCLAVQRIELVWLFSALPVSTCCTGCCYRLCLREL